MTIPSTPTYLSVSMTKDLHKPPARAQHILSSRDQDCSPQAAAAAAGDELMSDGGVQADTNKRRGSTCSNAGGAGGAGNGGAHRLNVFVLVRLLFHYLEKVDQHLLAEAKQALKDCDKRKRDGDPEYQQLSEAIPKRIRATVGNVHWARALAIQRNYLKQKQMQGGQRKPPAAAGHNRAGSKGGVGKKEPPRGDGDGDENMGRNTTNSSGRRPQFLAGAPGGVTQHAANLSTLQQRRELSTALGQSAGSVPGLLHRHAGQQQTPPALIIQHSPFAVAQQALAAQLEALNRVSRMSSSSATSPKSGSAGSGSGSEASAKYANYAQYSQTSTTAFGKRQLSEQGSSSESSSSCSGGNESDIEAEPETETETVMSTVPRS